MQINHNLKNYEKGLLWSAKIIFTALSIYFIFNAVRNYEIPNISIPVNAVTIIYTLTVFILMAVNWVLEAERWRISIPEEAISLHQSLQAVLAGQALNWVIPFTLGDAGGRLAPLQYKRKSAVALLINRVIMLSITSIYGGIACLYYFDLLSNGIIIFCVFCCVGIAWLILYKRHQQQVLVEFRKVFFISVFRYAIFALQFFLVIQLFIPELPALHILLGIGWIFFFRSLIPGLFGNFGIREASALVFFESSLSDPYLIVLPCSLIWVVNAVIPSLVGTLSVSNIKVKLAQ